MEFHLKALAKLNIDPETAPGLVHIYSEKPTAPFSGHPFYKENYERIVRHFLEQILFSDELETVTNGYYRSPMTLEAQYADMNKMNQPKITIERDDNYKQAFNITMNAFAPSKPIRVVHYVDTRHYPWPLSSSVERPFSTDPNVIKYVKNKCLNGEINDEKLSFHNTFDYVYNACRGVIHKIKDGQCFTGDLDKDHLYPITAHFRPGLGKAGSSALKNRLVWGVSKLLLIAECMFMYPLFDDYLRNGLSPLLWGYETILGGWSRLFCEIQPHLLEREATIITADWSEFDHRAQFEMIVEVITASEFYYHNDGYQPDHRYATASQNVFDKDRIKNLFIWTIYATLSSPLAMPDGKVWMRVRNGIPSGMFRTQWLDSIINGIMITTILLDAGFEVNKQTILKVLGDDSLTVIFVSVPPSKRSDLIDFLASRALTRFNAKLSIEKTEISDSLWNVELLGYRNFRGAATRDPLKLLAQLLYPESSAPTYSSLMGRCVGIAYADLGRNPRLYRVCKSIYDYLAGQGVTPDSRPARYLLAGSAFVESRMHLDVSQFPTPQKIQTFTMTPYLRSQADNNKYWPPEIFIDEYTR